MSERKILDAWLVFCDENYERCIALDKVYPIHVDNLAEWRKRMRKTAKNDCQNAIIDVIFQNTTNISFSTFHKKCLDICVDIERKLNKVRYENVVLVLSGELEKSNTWVAVLCSKILNKYLTEVRGELCDKDLSKYSQKTLFIHPDDMSYSGRQLHTSIPWPIRQTKIDHIDYFMLIPYAGTGVFENFFIEPVHSYKFSKQTVRIDSMRSIVIKTNPEFEFCVDPDMWKQVLGDMYTIISADVNVTLVYFDHKLADALSTLMKLFSTGCVGYGEGDKVGSLITGCPMSTDIECYEIPVDFEEEIHRCPGSFYKYIPYTLHGNLLDTKRHITEALIRHYQKHKASLELPGDRHPRRKLR